MSEGEVGDGTALVVETDVAAGAAGVLPGSTSAELREDLTRIANKRKATEAWLRSQPTVRMVVPGDRFHGTDACLVVYNGCRFEVPRNVAVDLPEPIAELLRVRIDSVNAANAESR